MERYGRISRHAQVDRIERLQNILVNIGFTSIVYEGVDNQNPEHLIQITDTGVIFIVSNSEQKVLVTGYLATVAKLTAVYKGGQNIPRDLKKRVIYNQKKFQYLYKQGLTNSPQYDIISIQRKEIIQ